MSSQSMLATAAGAAPGSVTVRVAWVATALLPPGPVLSALTPTVST